MWGAILGRETNIYHSNEYLNSKQGRLEHADDEE
jgi:hypothetical protein